MIDTVLKYLQQELNAYLAPGGEPAGDEARVEFPAAEPAESVQLPLNRVVPLLIRIEEEKTVRFADRYLRSRGSAEQPEYTSAPPAVPLHLYVLFIARFSDYLTGAKHLSSVIRFFQGRPALTPPNLPEIVAELHTPSFTVQNEIWSTLKAPQHPAVMYKITMLLLESETVTGGKVIQEVHTKLIQN